MKYAILTEPRSGSLLLASQLGDCAGEWFHEKLNPGLRSLMLGTVDDPNPFDYFNGFVAMPRHLERARPYLEQCDKLIMLSRDNERARLLSALVAAHFDTWHYKPGDSGLPGRFQVTSDVVRDLIPWAREGKFLLKPWETTDRSVHVTYEQVTNGSGLEIVCNALGRQVEDLQPPGCGKSPSYRDVIINAAEAEQIIDDELAK